MPTIGLSNFHDVLVVGAIHVQAEKDETPMRRESSHIPETDARAALESDHTLFETMNVMSEGVSRDVFALY